MGIRMKYFPHDTGVNNEQAAAMNAANGDFHAHVYGLSLAYLFNAMSARSSAMPFYQPNKN